MVTMRKIIICLFLIAPAALAAQTKIKTKPPVKSVAAGQWSMAGTLKGLADNSAVSLLSSDGKSTVLAATKAVKGKFKLTAKLPETAVYLLNTASPAQNIPLFIGNEKTTVSGDIAKPEAIAVTGSAVHNDFVSYSAKMQPLLEQTNVLTQFASTRGVTDSLKQAYQQATMAIMMEAERFLLEKPASPVSPLLLLVVKRFSPGSDYIEQKYNQLQPAAQNSFYGRMLGESFAAEKAGPNPIGSMAPDFTQNDANGNPVSLASYKGKYVLLDFWASWCRPCRDENPNVVENYNKFKDKNFTVLGVSLDRAKDPWLQAIQSDNLTWTHVSDLKFWSNAVAQQYGISSIPQNLLIGPDGKIVAKNLRGPELQSTLCKILGCN